MRCVNVFTLGRKHQIQESIRRHRHSCCQDCDCDVGAKIHPFRFGAIPFKKDRRAGKAFTNRGRDENTDDGNKEGARVSTKYFGKFLPAHSCCQSMVQ